MAGSKCDLSNKIYKAKSKNTRINFAYSLPYLSYYFTFSFTLSIVS